MYALIVFALEIRFFNCVKVDRQNYDLNYLVIKLQYDRSSTLNYFCEDCFQDPTGFHAHVDRESGKWLSNLFVDVVFNV